MEQNYLDEFYQEHIDSLSYFDSYELTCPACGEIIDESDGWECEGCQEIFHLDCLNAELYCEACWLKHKRYDWIFGYPYGD
jgi:hypothetical protein